MSTCTRRMDGGAFLTKIHSVKMPVTMTFKAWSCSSHNFSLERSLPLLVLSRPAFLLITIATKNHLSGELYPSGALITAQTAREKKGGGGSRRNEHEGQASRNY